MSHFCSHKQRDFPQHGHHYGTSRTAHRFSYPSRCPYEKASDYRVGTKASLPASE